MGFATKALAAAGLVLAFGIAVPGVAAANDVGDGSSDCNSGEHCFALHSNGGVPQKHFYNPADHGEYTFPGYVELKGEASSINNRDTVNDVFVHEEWDLFENNDYQRFSRGNFWQNFNGDVNDDNGHHNYSSVR
ncbi:hypothetical protein [Actinokineospora spheciospongiae]|uniref:hypothetical protein n=1 Tax=Actinokineospora spheciospongiae TaxID=909613 RepID=UPI000D70B639|nr:hypothetical protein [Actinokineospora spheciospongiae]PWW53738.1 hypothetical protein DFQ13_115122 [Actinokineospora spheciospongiae]